MLGVVAALAVVAAAAAGPASGKASGLGGQAALAAAQRPGTTVSAATGRQLASIGSQVDSLIGRMTLAEKIGQLEMSGPTGPNGTPGQTLFVLLEGGARVVRGSRTLRRLGPGDFFGEVAVMDGRPRSASVIAESDVRCVVLHRDELKRAMDEEPLVAWKLLQVLAARVRGD